MESVVEFEFIVFEPDEPIQPGSSLNNSPLLIHGKISLVALFAFLSK